MVGPVVCRTASMLKPRHLAITLREVCPDARDLCPSWPDPRSHHERQGLQNCNIQRAISVPVHVATLGLGGDQQASATNHGGVLIALFAYPFENYTEFWQLALATTPLAYGSFGENLTARLDG
jgi:hypothetical protein